MGKTKRLLAWGLGGLFVLGGFIELFSTPIPGIFALLAGLVIFPPSVKLLKEKWKIELSPVKKIILFITLLMISGAISPRSESKPISNPTPTPTQTANVEPTPITETIAPTNSPNPDFVAGTAYTNAFLNNVYPLMTSANDKVTKAGTAGANYDFETAKIEIDGALKDFTNAQNELRSIKTIPTGLLKANSLITSALGKYIDGAQTVKKGIEKYNADLITQGTEMYSQGTDLINQATKEITNYTTTLNK